MLHTRWDSRHHRQLRLTVFKLINIFWLGSPSYVNLMSLTQWILPCLPCYPPFFLWSHKGSMLEGPTPHVTMNVISSSLIPMPTQLFTLQLALKPVPASWLECLEVKRACAYLISVNFGGCGSIQMSSNKLWVSRSCIHSFPWKECSRKIRGAFHLQSQT